MTTFDFSSKDAEKWGSLLIQAGVIKGLNYRLTSTFKSKDKFIYGLGVSTLKKRSISISYILFSH